MADISRFDAPDITCSSLHVGARCATQRGTGAAPWRLNGLRRHFCLQPNNSSSLSRRQVLQASGADATVSHSGMRCEYDENLGHGDPGAAIPVVVVVPVGRSERGMLHDDVLLGPLRLPGPRLVHGSSQIAKLPTPETTGAQTLPVRWRGVLNFAGDAMLVAVTNDKVCWTVVVIVPENA